MHPRGESGSDAVRLDFDRRMPEPSTHPTWASGHSGKSLLYTPVRESSGVSPVLYSLREHLEEGALDRSNWEGLSENPPERIKFVLGG